MSHRSERTETSCQTIPSPGEQVVVTSGNTRTDYLKVVRGGCSRGCFACGAFRGRNTPNKSQIHPLEPGEIRENLLQEIRGETRLQVYQTLGPLVTCGIDAEPVENNATNDTAEIVDELTEGKSKVVVISHGLECQESVDENGKTIWKPIPEELKNLKATVELMKKDVIPRFILSIDGQRYMGLMGKDSQRLKDQLDEMEKEGSDFMKVITYQAVQEQMSQGLVTYADRSKESSEVWNARLEAKKKEACFAVQDKIQRNEPLNNFEETVRKYSDLKKELRAKIVEANAQSYAATVHALMPAIEQGKAVTFSLQGEPDSNSPVSIQLTDEIYQRMLDILDQEFRIDRKKLHDIIAAADIRPPRQYVRVGRATVLGAEQKTGCCMVIPDEKWAKDILSQEPLKTFRGMLDTDGSFYIQRSRIDRSYNDTADPKDNPWRKVGLSKDVPEVTELKIPVTFMERMQFHADPREIELPADDDDTKASVDLSQIYPLYCPAGDENQQQKLADLARDIADYVNLRKVRAKDKRFFIVEALIPNSEIEKAATRGEESAFLTRITLAEQIVALNTPAHDPKDPAAIRRAKKTGRVLAIKALLEERGIKIKLRGEKA